MRLPTAAAATAFLILAFAAPAGAANDLELVSTTAAPSTGQVQITLTARNNGPDASGFTQLYVEENNALQEKPNTAPDCHGGSAFAGTCAYGSVAPGATITATQTFLVNEDGVIPYSGIVETNGDTNAANNRRQGTFGGTSGGDGGPGGGGQRGNSPAVLQLVLSPFAFQAAATGPSLVGAVGTVGTAVTYRLSLAARATFRVLRPLPGRRVAGLCRRPTRANRSRPRCTRWVALPGSFTHQGSGGTNRFRFTGRLAGRRLAPGGYRLQIIATAGPNSSAPLRRAFRIRR